MIQALRQLLKERSTEFYVFLVLLWLLPGLALLALGFVYLITHHWFLWFSVGLIILALVTLVARIALKQNEQNKTETITHLDPIPDWSTQDQRIWKACLEYIGEKHLNTVPWEQVPTAILDLFPYVAGLYYKDEPDAEYTFTVPELLLMLEIWSREYRANVIERVPLSRTIKISSLRNLNRKTEMLRKVYKYGGPVITIARVLLDPAGGVASEIRSRLLSELSIGFNEHMQRNMKQTLFEQVIQVAIDLYSGRLKLSEDELNAIRISQKPPEQVVVRPLSVMVIGQVNAGKSSLINQLEEQCVAEVDVLPSTEGFYHHHLFLADDLEMFLIDTPGLDGSKKNSKMLLQEVVNADLILWLSQANQPAKALDKQLLERINVYFSENISRKNPPIVLVSTHNDMLFPGRWRPPYDLTDASDKSSVKMIEALNYIHSSIGFSTSCPMIPISLAPDCEPYNIGLLRETLQAASSEARAAQLNRERLVAVDITSSIAKVLQQATGLLKWGVDIALK